MLVYFILFAQLIKIVWEKYYKHSYCVKFEVPKVDIYFQL